MSFREASTCLSDLAELDIDQREVERVTFRVADDVQRIQAVELASYAALPLMSKLESPIENPPIAVAMSVDGSYLQVRPAKKKDGSDAGNAAAAGTAAAETSVSETAAAETSLPETSLAQTSAAKAAGAGTASGEALNPPVLPATCAASANKTNADNTGRAPVDTDSRAAAIATPAAAAGAAAIATVAAENKSEAPAATASPSGCETPSNISPADIASDHGAADDAAGASADDTAGASAEDVKNDQKNDAKSGSGPQKKARFWREYKGGSAQILEHQTYAEDPCPLIPDCFIDREYITQTLAEIAKVRKPSEGETFHRQPDATAPAALPSKPLAATSPSAASPSQEPAASPPASACPAPPPPQPLALTPPLAPAASVPQASSPQPHSYASPTVTAQHYVATRLGVEHLTQLLLLTAFQLGFTKAAAKAFIGDGSAWIWNIWKTHFSDYEPVLDFLHLLSYLFTAAHAGGPAGPGWLRYQDWAQLAWSGRVTELLQAIRARLAELDALPHPPDAKTREAFTSALTYIENHAQYMNYPKYRQLGLPVTSSQAESAMKQINRRAKGTEKFWSEDGAEKILLLRSLYMSTDNPMADYWKQREQKFTGCPPYKSRAA